MMASFVDLILPSAQGAMNGKDRDSSVALFVTGKHALRVINRVSDAVRIEHSCFVGSDQRPSASIQRTQQRATRDAIVLLRVLERRFSIRNSQPDTVISGLDRLGYQAVFSAKVVNVYAHVLPSPL